HRDESRVSATLLLESFAGVDEDDRKVRRGGAGDHVAGVLDVPGRIGDDELAPRGGEIAIGDVDRDSLFALGAETVGEESEVGVVITALDARALYRFELIFKD